MLKYNIKRLSTEELENEYKLFKSKLEDFYSTAKQKPLVAKYEILDFIY